LAVRGPVSLMRDNQRFAITGAGRRAPQIVKDRLAEKRLFARAVDVAQLRHRPTSNVVADKYLTPLTLSSDRRTVESIRSPSGSADSSRKGWPPKVGNGRRAAQKPNACHPVASRSRRCPLQAPPRFFVYSTSPHLMGRWRRRRRRGCVIHGEVAPKAPEGLRRPHSWEVAPKAPEGPCRALWCGG